MQLYILKEQFAICRFWSDMSVKLCGKVQDKILNAVEDESGHYEYMQETYLREQFVS